MNIRRLIPVLCIAVLSAAGCSKGAIPQPPKAQEIKEVKIVKLEEALYCFKCHAAENYRGGGGKFPHVKHAAEFGIRFHCNQCHDFKGHHYMKTIKKTASPCSNCH